MKRIVLLYIVVLLSGWILAGCNDFLEESSQGEVRPTTVDELYQIMLGEAYPRAVSGGDIIMPYLEFLTDNMQNNPIVNESETALKSVETYLPIFTWKKEMYEECSLLTGVDTWDLFYKRINGCNVVIEYLDRVKGDEEDKLNMKGQVLLLRGWWYFQLVNLYGLPYNAGDPSKNLGVPLKLDMDVTDKLYARNSVAEVYVQVEKDLLEGVSILDTHGVESSSWKMNAPVGRALLSRVYLYMGNWEKAVLYADSVLAVRSGLCDFSKFSDVNEMIAGYATGKATENGVYNSNVSKEILWMYGLNSEFVHYTGFSAYSNPATYTVSEDLIGCFEKLNAPGNDGSTDAGDLRRIYQIHNASYYSGGYVYFPYWVFKHGTNGFYSFDRSAKGIRTAELYLNRAEAYIQRYRETGNVDFRNRAIADLNTLREARFDTRNVDYVPVEQRADIDISTPDRLYAFCLEERRRELMFEDHRWFDLRRTGMPRLEHRIQARAGDQVRSYVLEEGSSHYVLPIPEKVMRDNAKLEQNKYND